MCKGNMFLINLPDKTENSLCLKQFTVKGHNWVSLTYCGFNLYLVITRLIHNSKGLDSHLSLSSYWDWFNGYQEFLVESLLIVEHIGGIKIYILGSSKYRQRVGGSRKFYWGKIFFTKWRELQEEWFWWFEPFSKLKTTFCEYWISIKMKINMTSVSK